jgi:hypothetical protein
MSLYPDLKRKYPLEPDAVRALGKVSPELAWLQVRTLVQGAIEEYFQAAKELANRLNWSCQLEDLSEILGSVNPVRGVNELVYTHANQELNLEDIPSLPPLQVLEAVLKMCLENERWQGANSQIPESD